MALVRVLRMDGNDDPSYEYPVQINPNIDQLVAKGFYPQGTSGVDANVGIERGVGNKLMLRDLSTGNWPLLNLLCLSEFSEIKTDVTTSSTGWVNLLSLSIKTVAGQNLYILALSTFSNATANTANYFRVVIDGVVSRGSAGRYINTPATHASILTKVTQPTADAHTVALQWKVGGGTCRIRPVTAPDSESCSLMALAMV